MSSPAERRKPLSKKRRAEMAIEQNGRCGCADVPSVHPLYADFPVCGGKLSASEGIIDEHLWPLAAGGSNAPENRRLLRKPCAQLKTDEYDKPLIAKTKGMAGERGSQIHRRENGKKRAWPSGKLNGGGFQRGHRPIQSQGFAKAKPQRSATKPVVKGGVS